MKPEKLRRKIVAKYGFLYSLDPCVDRDFNFLSIDGMNAKGVYYVVARLNDGQIERDIFEDFREVTLFPFRLNDQDWWEWERSYKHLFGNLPKLIEQGVPFRNLFWAMQSQLHFLKPEQRHETTYALAQ